MATKKILYIDPLSPRGHLLYNHILIKDILEQGCDVFAVSKKDYLSKLGFDNRNFTVLLEIPSKYFDKLDNGNGLVNRYRLFKILKFIERNIEFSDYDIVVFSSYDEISFLFSSVPRGSYLISHNNFSNLNKRWFIKRLSFKHNIIVLSKYLQNHLRTLGINVSYMQHGTAHKFISNGSDKLFEEKYRVKDFRFVLFSPSADSTDISLFEELCDHSNFIEFLKENKILLIVRNSEQLKCENILTITDFMLRDEYEFLFRISNAILINYGANFENRVSGVYYEAIANLKPVIVSDNFYKKIYPKDSYAYSFKTISDLQKSIEYLLNKKQGLLVSRKMEIYKPNLISKIAEWSR